MELFQAEALDQGMYRISDAAGTKMYLVVGTASALLLDCGAGAGDVAAFVRGLTDKPLRVLITHGHVDHAMGSGAFGPEVEIYMGEADRDIYREHSTLAMRQDFVARSFQPSGNGSFPAVCWYDVRPAEALLPLRPGDLFDVGGEVVEVCPGAGHTHGCVTLLLRQRRMLLLGDACNPNTFLFDTYSCPVSQYKATLQALKQCTAGRYDRVLLCHGPGDGEPNLIDGAIWLCDAILEGRDDHHPCTPMGKPAFSAKKIAPGAPIAVGDIGDHSSANILYSPITCK